MTDRFVTWGNSEGEGDVKAFRRTTDASSTNVYFREEVLATFSSAAALTVAKDIVVDTNNTTATPLGAGATYTGTATDITRYSQLVVDIFGRPGVVAGDGSSAMGSFFFEFSGDGATWDVSVPALVRDPSLVIPVPVIHVHRYFRVRYLNDGGAAAIAALGLTDIAGTPTAQTVFRLTTYLHPFATKELTRTLDQGIQGSDPVNLSRSVVMGRSPDGQYINEVTGGKVSTNCTTVGLAAGSTFTGGWTPTAGYQGMTVMVKADQPSASTGIHVEFSETSAGTFIHRDENFEYLSTGNGQARYFPSQQGSFMRVRYVNGATASTNFVLRTEMYRSNSQFPLSGVESLITSNSLAQMSRSLISALSTATGNYTNVQQSPLGGFRIAMREHEVETPIKSMDVWHTSGAGVSTASAPVVVTPLSNRRSISFKANPANTRTVYLNSQTSASTATGFPLSAGDSLDLEVSSAVSFSAKCDPGAGSQDLRWVEVASS